jgi:hypothetical protein
MPPLPENSTKTWFFDYVQGSYSHTFQIRTTTGILIDSVDAALLLLLPSIGGLVSASLITAARLRNKGSLVSIPVDSERIGDTFGTGGVTNDNAPLSVKFVGRSLGGVRVSLTFFGYRQATSSWRLTETEDANVNDAVDTLNSGVDIFLAVDETKPLWYPYANIGANDHWVKRARG